MCGMVWYERVVAIASHRTPNEFHEVTHARDYLQVFSSNYSTTLVP